jgi:hypothetical protein
MAQHKLLLQTFLFVLFSYDQNFKLHKKKVAIKKVAIKKVAIKKVAIKKVAIKK